MPNGLLKYSPTDKTNQTWAKEKRKKNGTQETYNKTQAQVNT